VPDARVNGGLLKLRKLAFAEREQQGLEVGLEGARLADQRVAGRRRRLGELVCGQAVDGEAQVADGVHQLFD